MKVTVVTNSELGWDCVVIVTKGNKADAVKKLNEECGEDVDARDEAYYTDRCHVFKEFKV